jgi:hypothetical protein
MHSLAQKQDYVWLFGKNSQTNVDFAGSVIDFNSQPPDIFHEFRHMRFNVTNSSICDSSGNLLFYTNGITIYNKEHEIMENGDSLNPGAHANTQHVNGYILEQGTLALTHPGSDSLYYLFHIDKIISSPFYSKHLYYSLIDMSQNNGVGRVVEKNIEALESQFELGKLTATKHANGIDWWLLIRKFNSNQYQKILVTADSILNMGIQTIGEPIPSPGIGQAVFSPDGSKFASHHLVGFFGDTSYINIYDFDRCTGELSEPIEITKVDSAASGGAAISPNSRFLYISSYNHVFQYDLWSSDIEASKDTVAIYDGFLEEPIFRTRFFLCQLAPDGKIYINTPSSTHYLHVINHPDLPGDACDVCQHCVWLPSSNSFSMPNFPNYRLGASETVCDTTTNTVFSVNALPEITIFPNPATSHFNIKFAEPLSKRSVFILSNTLGEIVLQKEIPSFTEIHEFDVSQFPTGICYYSIQTEREVLKKGKLLLVR